MNTYKISLLVDEEWLKALQKVTNVDTYDEVCTWLSVEEDKFSYMDARQEAYKALANDLLDAYLESADEAEVEARLMGHIMKEVEA